MSTTIYTNSNPHVQTDFDMGDWVTPDDFYDDSNCEPFVYTKPCGWTPGWNKGLPRSEEEKKHLSEVNKERNINFVSTGATEAARQSNLGKKQSPQHIAKRAKAKQRKVCVEGVVYDSLTSAAESLGVHITAISGRLTRGKSAYYV